MPVVGLLSSFSSNERNTAALNQGLKELGFVDGQNVVIDYRYAEGHYDQLPGLAAASVERKIAVASARTEGDLDAAFAILVHRSADVLFVINDPYFSSIRGQIVALAAHYALPAAYFSRYFPAAGGQMSYGTDFAEAYQIFVALGTNPNKEADRLMTKFAASVVAFPQKGELQRRSAG